MRRCGVPDRGDATAGRAGAHRSFETPSRRSSSVRSWPSSLSIFSTRSLRQRVSATSDSAKVRVPSLMSITHGARSPRVTSCSRSLTWWVSICVGSSLSWIVIEPSYFGAHAASFASAEIASYARRSLWFVSLTRWPADDASNEPAWPPTCVAHDASAPPVGAAAPPASCSLVSPRAAAIRLPCRPPTRRVFFPRTMPWSTAAIALRSCEVSW